ncbi:hypothetical protein BD410DRAFT_796418 [Rickenella mellea]|uniref:Uncharacterized protein n=1 Tax=Rickenella mellea TaxID=50990 RepID=A0A4Y7PK46_9AGAM|nr:hypothetical protein BD410DRAFT_796418 [Rickenella mellea]
MTVVTLTPKSFLATRTTPADDAEVLVLTYVADQKEDEVIVRSTTGTAVGVDEDAAWPKSLFPSRLCS